MIYKEIKNIFTDTKYGLVDMTIESEYQEEYLTMNLFHKPTGSTIEIKMNILNITEIEQLKEKIKDILNMS
jgi:hypothetical protein